MASDVRRLSKAVTSTVLLLVGLSACSGDEATPTSPSGVPAAAREISLAIEGEPCIAPATGTLSCSFVVMPPELRTGFDFSWRIENPANGRASQGGAAPQSSLLLPCSFSSGVAQFDVIVRLFVSNIGQDAYHTVTRSATVRRPPGDCGT